MAVLDLQGMETAETAPGVRPQSGAFCSTVSIFNCGRRR
jgi:hypothetical protein